MIHHMGALGLCAVAALSCQPVPLIPALGELRASPQTLELSRVAVGERSEAELVLSNLGDAPIAIESITLEGGAASSFGLLSVQPRSLQAGGSLRLGVQYFPSMAGQHLARLVIRSNASNGPLLEVPVRGEAFSGARCGAPSVEGSACSDGDPCTDGDRCRVGRVPGAGARLSHPAGGPVHQPGEHRLLAEPGPVRGGQLLLRAGGDELRERVQRRRVPA